MWSVDVPLSRDAALSRMRLSINLPKKRALGVLKTQDEFIGVVADDEFEIWERRGHAVHAVGRVRTRGRGSRIEVDFRLTPRTRILAVLFFALYALAVVQFIALRGSPATGTDGLVAALGALVPLGIFGASTWMQREGLRSFVSRVYRNEVP